MANRRLWFCSWLMTCALASASVGCGNGSYEDEIAAALKKGDGTTAPSDTKDVEKEKPTTEKEKPTTEKEKPTTGKEKPTTPPPSCGEKPEPPKDDSGKGDVVNTCVPGKLDGLDCKLCYGPKGEPTHRYCGVSDPSATCKDLVDQDGLTCSICYAAGQLVSEVCEPPAPPKAPEVCKEFKDADGLLCRVCTRGKGDTWYCNSETKPEDPQKCGEEKSAEGLVCKVCRDTAGRPTSKTCFSN